ncbi:MAG: hypothetical protein LBK59_04010 [Bifidobacteriaceae bacterium]|jgi:hypothetical protein|nr:hypothetical protein [Bifidobacteriaceae bacterium]
MTVKPANRAGTLGRRNRKILTMITAGVSAAGLALATPLSAWALSGVITEGDLDVIEVEATETSPHAWDVELVGHDHVGDEEFDPADVTYQIAAIDGVGYIGEDDLLSAGFAAGDPAFLADLADSQVTFTIASAARTGVTSGDGDVLIEGDQDHEIAIELDADTYGTAGTESFSLDGHVHPTWEFWGQGVYVLTFTVTADPASGVTVEGLPASVDVTVDVV